MKIMATTLLSSMLPFLAGTAPAWAAIAKDAVVSTSRSGSGTSITSPRFSTASVNQLLLAFVATGATSAGVTVTGVTGAGLTWVFVSRTNVQMGTSEIWRAFAPTTLSVVTVKATMSQSVAASITVVSFSGVDTSGTHGSGAVGATGSGNANPGAPTATLVTTRSNSWVFGVGNDWDRATSRTIGTNQKMVRQYLASVGNTYWVQGQSAPTVALGTRVIINDIAPAGHRYNLSIVEVLPAAVNHAPVVSAGSDQTITLPTNSVTLTGTAADDGLPAPPGALTDAWSLVSGPGTVVFSAPSALTTLATFDAAGTYTLRLTVSDSALATAADVHVTIIPIRTVVTISPKQGGLAIAQPLAVTATVQNDVGNAGVTWSASGNGCSGPACGSFTSATTTSATYVASSTAGIYAVTATSVADVTVSASATVGVTDLPGVLTYHNNLSRDGTNTREYVLTPSAVTAATFGKLFSCQVDGAIYAQPLWVPRVTVGGSQRNVVVVATQHDSVYVFDADASPCVLLWHANLIDAAHGGSSGEAPVPSGIGGLVGAGYGDISPEVGVTGTPVVDAATNKVYVLSKSAGGSHTFFQRLHGLDLSTGSETVPPQSIDSSIVVAGTGDGSVNGQIPFDPGNEHQRPGLVLSNGVVYVSWASHEDHDPYHGWVIGFNASTLAPVANAVFNTTPNHTGPASYSRGGIWMGGGAPAVDTSGNLYLITGNGTFDANAGGSNYGDSVVKLSTTSGLTATDYFTPSTQATLDANDTDFGSGGAAILVDQPTGPVSHLLIVGGKDGNLFLLNRDAMGHFNSSSNAVLQTINQVNSIFATPVFWQNGLYVAGENGVLKQFIFNPSTGSFNGVPSSQSVNTYRFPGATPSLSSKGATDGIIWALDNSQYCTPQSTGCGPAILHAYDATNLSSELWNSSQAAGQRDQAGRAVKFTVPTVVNGKVYVGTRGNDTTVLGELEVYGLLPR
jgi:hypothetical protein